MAMTFEDRGDAGRRLAARLVRAALHEPVVLALPRGGVPVAAEIARALDAPLDLVLVKKIGAPGQPELAIAALVEGSPPLLIENAGILRDIALPPGYLDAERSEKMREIARQQELYLGSRARADLTGRTAILVDDGIATGTTMDAALAAIVQRHPKAIWVVVPAGPVDTIEDFRSRCDGVMCLEESKRFRATSLFYRDFHQVTDEEVVAALAATRAPGA
jgi:predicted phosphoribosyltransferase